MKDWGSCNDLKYGVYLTHKSNNSPTDRDWHMIVSVVHQSGTGIQLGIPLISNSNIYIRVCAAGNWLSWSSINN